jgi:hypothetical protein
VIRLSRKVIPVNGKAVKTVAQRAIPWIVLLVISATMLMLQADAKASDVGALEKMLAAASIADQTVFMCTLENRSFAQQTAGPRGTSQDYLEHVKKEVLSSIPPLEARQIIVDAAEITRTVGRRQLPAISASGPADTIFALRNWCETEGVRIVRNFMEDHDRNHEKFLSAVAEAKRPAM